MRVSTRLNLAFNRLSRRYKVGKNQGLYQVSSLIRKEAREKIRVRAKGARPLAPAPGTDRTTVSAHTRGGLREINYHVSGSHSIIGPRKFRNSNFFNRPVPNIHEMGGTAIARGLRSSIIARYPQRSFMYVAVKRLQRKGKIARKFSVSLQRSW